MDTGSLNPLAASLAASLNARPERERREQQQLIQAVKALNGAEYLGDKQELTFVLDEQTKRPVVRLVDRDTGEVVREIPPKHVLNLAREMAKRK